MPTPHETREQQMRHQYQHAMQEPVKSIHAPALPGADTLVPVVPEIDESILHPMKAVKDLLYALGCIEQRLREITQLLRKQKTFKDIVQIVGPVDGHTVDYARHDACLLYVYSTAGVTLTFTPGGTRVIPAATWVDISPQKGALINGPTTPTTIVLRYTDTAL